VRWTNTQVRETLSIFNLTMNGGQTGSHSRSLTRFRRFHPSIRACNTCRKTRAEVYKAL